MIKKMKILMIASEAVPFAATGGLGDVLGSLPQAIRRGSPETELRVVLPLYHEIRERWGEHLREEWQGTVSLAWRNQKTGFFSLALGSVIYYFVDQPYYFDRTDGIYGYPDDGERFAFFCMAALNLAEKVSFIPDILHCHDWHAALAAVYLKTVFRHDNRFFLCDRCLPYITLRIRASFLWAGCGMFFRFRRRRKMR